MTSPHNEWDRPSPRNVHESLNAEEVSLSLSETSGIG